MCKMKLTPKQKDFCEQYVVDLNGKQAAIRAGYSAKTAKEIACENLTKPNIMKYLAKLIAKRSDKTEITAEYVLTGLQEVAERCLQRVPVLDKDGKETGEWRFEASGANRSLELLGRHLEMFTDKLKVDENIIIIVEDLRDKNIDDN